MTWREFLSEFWVEIAAIIVSTLLASGVCYAALVAFDVLRA